VGPARLALRARELESPLPGSSASTAVGAALNACRQRREELSTPASSGERNPLSVARWKHAMRLNTKKMDKAPSMASSDTVDSEVGFLPDLEPFDGLEAAPLEGLFVDSLEFSAPWGRVVD